MFSCFGQGVVDRGWSLVVPGHTLAPDAGLPDIVAEIGTCLDVLQAHRERYGLLGPVILSGWSSGGHLAAMHTDHPFVFATVCLSGLYDLRPIVSTPFINDPVRMTDAVARSCSGLLRASPRKPVVICAGQDELPPLVNDAVDYAEKLRRDGRDVRLLLVPGADHPTMLHELAEF